MAALTCAGKAVTRGEVEVPRSGPWHADLWLDADTAPSGAVELVWDGAPSPWRGFVVPGRAGVLTEGGPVEVRVVGGAGGLGKRLPGQSYRSATARLIVEQLLAAAGERLDGSTATALLVRQLARWSRAAGTTGEQLDALAGQLGVSWRVLPGGKVWLGVPPTTPLSLPPEAVVVRRQPVLAQVELAHGSPWTLTAGGTFEGRTVASLSIQLSPTRFRSVLCLS
jgi:hypothetical protein